MHTLLCVAGVLYGPSLSVVRGFGFSGWARPRGCMSRDWLYRDTHAAVMLSRAARVSMGPLWNGDSVSSTIGSLAGQPEAAR